VLFVVAINVAQAESNDSLGMVLKIENAQTQDEKILHMRSYVAIMEDSQSCRSSVIANSTYNFNDVREAAEFASSVTGVRKDFLMGMLTVESDLGRNTGRCTYGEVETDAKASYEQGLLSDRTWSTFQKRKKTVKRIARELGYDHSQLKVSCNPTNYAGTGGAMGVPQFMPDTWIEYKERIARVVGKKHPDPWNLKDGVVAMALKLSDVPGVTQHNRYAERNAAKLYLSGTTSWRYNWYANRTQYWSENYKQLAYRF